MECAEGGAGYGVALELADNQNFEDVDPRRWTVVPEGTFLGLCRWYEHSRNGAERSMTSLGTVPTETWSRGVLKDT